LTGRHGSGVRQSGRQGRPCLKTKPGFDGSGGSARYFVYADRRRPSQEPGRVWGSKPIPDTYSSEQRIGRVVHGLLRGFRVQGLEGRGGEGSRELEEMSLCEKRAECRGEIARVAGRRACRSAARAGRGRVIDRRTRSVYRRARGQSSKRRASAILGHPRSRDELIRLPAAPGGPFGEQPGPWYARRREPGLPKAYAITLGLVSAPVSAWAASGLHGVDRIVVGFVVLVAPSWALESWWKERRRMRDDRLLPELEQGPT
jgi:hypothetical protein